MLPVIELYCVSESYRYRNRVVMTVGLVFNGYRVQLPIVVAYSYNEGGYILLEYTATNWLPH